MLSEVTRKFLSQCSPPMSVAENTTAGADAWPGVAQEKSQYWLCLPVIGPATASDGLSRRPIRGSENGLKGGKWS